MYPLQASQQGPRANSCIFLHTNVLVCCILVTTKPERAIIEADGG